MQMQSMLTAAALATTIMTELHYLAEHVGSDGNFSHLWRWFRYRPAHVLFSFGFLSVSIHTIHSNALHAMCNNNNRPVWLTQGM
jgi:ABC-type multidrug transport system permease subunit